MGIEDLVVPEQIAARPVALGKNRLGQSDRLGRLGVVLRFDDDARFAREIGENRLGKLLVERRVHDDFRRLCLLCCDNRTGRASPAISKQSAAHNCSSQRRHDIYWLSAFSCRLSARICILLLADSRQPLADSSLQA